MKRTFTSLLILVTVCMFSAAVAQDIVIHKEDALFYIEVTLPSGARVSESTANDHSSMTCIEFLTPGRPSVTIRTAADELYVGQSLSDLSEDEIKLIINGITVEMTDPDVEIHTTAEGYEYIVANETTKVNDTCDTVMLVNGYFIMVQVFYADFSELTEQDMEIGPSIVETFRFIGHTNT